ncbi:hypothetical protein QTP70_031854 [Hemibagrus guttatus]|uniref:Tc1-like transposase DDE domain-containing protein n=1 Tax=Hemibagrus guttatus TaxID=175788 RepID=A0AAE0R696_9TELE|nr:hypothetical protein QTP70_031854 [Hemibagrus guttatus]
MAVVVNPGLDRSAKDLPSPLSSFHSFNIKILTRIRMICHATKQEWFDEHNNEFEVLTWPSNSPDLNPIEHLWDVLDKQIRSMEAPPRNLEDLKDLMLTSWRQIPQHTFRDLVESMPRWVRAILAAKGRPTQY